MISEASPHAAITKVAVLGAGNMGTALAHALASQGTEVVIWDFFPDVIEDIRVNRENTRFLPGVALHSGVRVCRTAGECVSGAGLVIACVPSAFIADMLASVIPALDKHAVLLTVAKGFTPGTQEPLIFSLERLVPDHAWVHLAGPCVANEFARGQQAFVTMASPSEEAGRRVAECFNSPFFQAGTTTDVMGAALGGILKNVYAVLMGCLHTLTGSTQNLSATAVTACIAEMADITAALGGERSTIYGLAGLGDLVATGFSSDSHNRHLGERLASGKKLSEIEQELGWLPEGARAASTICDLAKAAGVPAPLAQWVKETLKGRSPVIGELLGALREATRVLR